MQESCLVPSIPQKDQGWWVEVGVVCRVWWWSNMTLEKVSLRNSYCGVTWREMSLAPREEVRGQWEPGEETWWTPLCLFPWLRFIAYMLSINNTHFWIISHAPDFAEFHPSWVWRSHLFKGTLFLWEKRKAPGS